jgi:hypothetical protein
MPHVDSHTTITKVAEARGRSGLLVIDGYCASSGCPAREIDIRVKDHDHDLIQLLTARGLRCPLCGEPLKCHEVITFREQAAVDARDARCSVNAQVYERDHGPFVPASVLLDDRLPHAGPA